MSYSPEFRALLLCFEELESALRGLDYNFVQFLVQAGFITDDSCLLNSEIPLQDTWQLMRLIKERVKSDSKSYHKLVYRLRKDSSYQHIIKRLDDEYYKQLMQCGTDTSNSSSDEIFRISTQESRSHHGTAHTSVSTVSASADGPRPTTVYQQKQQQQKQQQQQVQQQQVQHQRQQELCIRQQPQQPQQQVLQPPLEQQKKQPLQPKQDPVSTSVSSSVKQGTSQGAPTAAKASEKKPAVGVSESMEMKSKKNKHCLSDDSRGNKSPKEPPNKKPKFASCVPVETASGLCAPSVPPSAGAFISSPKPIMSATVYQPNSLQQQQQQQQPEQQLQQQKQTQPFNSQQKQQRPYPSVAPVSSSVKQGVSQGAPAVGVTKVAGQRRANRKKPSSPEYDVICIDIEEVESKNMHSPNDGSTGNISPSNKKPRFSDYETVKAVSNPGSSAFMQAVTSNNVNAFLSKELDDTPPQLIIVDSDDEVSSTNFASGGQKISSKPKQVKPYSLTATTTITTAGKGSSSAKPVSAYTGTLVMLRIPSPTDETTNLKPPPVAVTCTDTPFSSASTMHVLKAQSSSLTQGKAWTITNAPMHRGVTSGGDLLTPSSINNSPPVRAGSAHTGHSTSDCVASIPTLSSASDLAPLSSSAKSMRATSSNTTLVPSCVVTDRSSTNTNMGASVVQPTSLKQALPGNMTTTLSSGAVTSPQDKVQLSTPTISSGAMSSPKASIAAPVLFSLSSELRRFQGITTSQDNFPLQATGPTASNTFSSFAASQNTTSSSSTFRPQEPLRINSESSVDTVILESQQESHSEYDDNEIEHEIEEIVSKGLDEGIVKLHIVKCGVSGPPDTGKSNVRALMLGLDRPEERQSTAVATEADQLTSRIDAVEDMVGIRRNKKGQIWTIVKSDGMARAIANTLHDEDYSKNPQSTILGVGLRSQRKDFKIINDVKKHLKRLRGKSKRKKKGLNGIKFVFFVDTGGQPQFQEILPNFIRCNINILVHNLSQSLTHCPHFDYVIDGRKYRVPEKMKLSNLSIIEQSVRSIMSTIVSADVDRKPSVVILGTFKDKCNPNPEEFERMLREKTAVINEKIKPYVGNAKGKCSLYLGHRGKDQVIVAVDGSQSGWESNVNHNILEKLKDYIDRQAENRPIDVPIKFFIFLQQLKAHAKKMKTSYVTLEMCENIAPVINMSKSDIKEALNLFHDCNLILYFSKVLENIAFITPGFLFGRVTDLIVSSFHCESDYMTQQRVYFQTTGIFTTEILNDTPSLRLSEGEFTQQLFIKLLKGLFVVAELDPGTYFMPCVLPLEELREKVDEYKVTMLERGVYGPLVISFYHDMSPRGLFCALLVALAGNPGWKLSDLRENAFRSRNSVEFDVSIKQAEVVRAHIGKVAIIDRNRCLEIYTTCESSQCTNIRETVCTALEEACINLHYSYSYLTYLGFPCTIACGCTESHSTNASVFSDVWKEKCMRMQRKRPVVLPKEKLSWFRNDSCDDANMDPELFFRLLCSEVATKTNSWSQIAVNLDITLTDINRIAVECTDVQACFMRVFDKWRREARHPFTWNTIITILRATGVDEHFLAQQLHEKYCPS